MFWCSAMVMVHTALLLSTEGNSLCASYDHICSNTSRFVGFLSTASSCPLASEHTSPVLSHMPPHEYCCLSQQQRQLVSQSSCNQMVCWSGVIIINMAVMADRHYRCCSFFSCATGQGDFFPPNSVDHHMSPSLFLYFLLLPSSPVYLCSCSIPTRVIPLSFSSAVLVPWKITVGLNISFSVCPVRVGN